MSAQVLVAEADALLPAQVLAKAADTDLSDLVGIQAEAEFLADEDEMEESSESINWTDLEEGTQQHLKLM